MRMLLLSIQNAEPRTGRIARQIETHNGMANQSVIKKDDLTKSKTEFGSISRNAEKNLHMRN